MVIITNEASLGTQFPFKHPSDPLWPKKLGLGPVGVGTCRVYSGRGGRSESCAAWGSLCRHSEQLDGKRAFEVTKGQAQSSGNLQRVQRELASGFVVRRQNSVPHKEGPPSSGSSCVEVMSSFQGSECY